MPQNKAGNFVNDPRGLSEQEFRFAVWWAEHGRQLGFWWVRVIAVLTLALVTVDLFFLVRITVSWRSHQRMVGGIANNVVVTPAKFTGGVAQSLQFSDVRVIGDEDQFVDIVVKVKNPNVTWAVEELGLQFAFEGGVVERTFQLLPEEETYLVVKNVSMRSGSRSTVTRSETEIVWRKGTRDELTNRAFDVQGSQVEDAVTSDGRTLTRVKADVRNISVEHISDALFQIVLLNSAGTVVAVQEQTISEFQSLSTRPLIVTFNRKVVGATRVQILPVTTLD